MSEQPQYFYSLKQHRVVTADEDKAEDRLGPYATRAEAENALQNAAARNLAWVTDPRFNDDDEDDEDRTHLDGSPIEQD